MPGNRERTNERTNQLHQEILERVAAQEAYLKAKRLAHGKSIMNRKHLTTQMPTVTGWKPKKKDRRIFFLSSCKHLRFEFIRYFEHFCEKCRELYKAWKGGIPPEDWPHEAYLPQQP